jgi:hypothetical protein
MQYKLKVKITQGILRQSAECGFDGNRITKSCAITNAIRHIIPNAATGLNQIVLAGNHIGHHNGIKFVDAFDDCFRDAKSGLITRQEGIRRRLALPETEVTITLSDEFIQSINIDDLKTAVSKEQHLELVEGNP